MRTTMLIACLLISSSAMAANSDAICGGLTDRDGISCKVRYIEGTGDTLFIRLNVKKSDAAARVAAAKAATRRAVDTFMLSGGVFIEMRRTREDGVELERLCSKIKGRRTEHCEAWVPVKG